MITAPLKVILLALLPFVASAIAGRAADDPPGEKEIVIDDDVFAFDGDGPLVLRFGRHSGRGYIGIRLIEMTPELRAHYGAPRDAGVLVAGVEPESAAAKAGIQVGDIITSADGERIESARELSRAIRRKKGGEALKLEVFRDRATKHLTVTVEERKREEIDRGDLPRRLRGRAWILPDFDSKRAAIGRLEDLGRLQERLEELEKRLNDLEKKMPAR